jgi:1L-myo-inositol 1-phosphate cytidylyltransferase
MNCSIPEVAVILAAGLGSRLKSDVGVPKPLRKVARRALILHVLDRFSEAGVKEAVVVVGYRKDDVVKGVMDADPPIHVTFVENPQFELKNGLSVLAAKRATRGKVFFLSMSDHIFEPSLIKGLASASIPDRGLVLAVDSKLDSIYDMDDATKVRTSGDRIIEIGKDLKIFDAVDTGLFACSSGLFDALESRSMAQEGDCSLSDGVQTLAQMGLALVHDVGAGIWQDVDTPETETHAEKLFGPGTRRG